MKKKHLFLPLALLVALLLRTPSLFEPNWYGDEGIYQTIGLAMAKGRPLYEGIWDNKPPLLYMIYALFAGDQFWVRLSSLIVMLFTIISFYLLAKKLFVQERVVQFATVLFALLFSLPFLEGNIANSENFMLLPIIIAMTLVFTFIDLKNYMNYFVAGLLFGLAFLLKIVAIFDLATAVVFVFVLWFRKDIKMWFMKSFFLGLGFVIPVAITLFYFISNGALSDFITAVFAQNVTYVGAGNKLFIGQGFLIVKLILLGIICLVIYIRRNQLSKGYIFIYLWLAFSIFNAFFGGRSWIHYLLTLLPAFTFFLGIIIENQKLRYINFTLCAILLLLIAKNFWIYGKTVSYYVNFMQFVTGNKDVNSYLNFFDWYVARDYEIATYIRENSNENDTIYIWGDNAQIYALAKRLPVGRYTVSYHISFYPNALSETKAAIEKKKPPFIIATRDDFPNELLRSGYSLKREVKGVKIFEREIQNLTF